MRVAVDAAGGRVPVLVGIGHSTRIACALARAAEQAGAAGLMVHPAYFIEPAEEGILGHYRALAAATSLGLMAFSTKGAVHTPDMIERLAEVPTVVALKDEHGDLRLFTEMVERLGPRLTWVNGMAEALAAPYCAAGAQAMTSGIVNIAPDLSRAVWEASAAGQWAEARQLVARLRPLIRLRERRRGYQIAVIKEAMNLLGQPGGEVRSPLTPLTAEDRRELRAALVGLGLPEQAA
jgi:5-dehydro-4-deoxyglucarate dehydratase